LWPWKGTYIIIKQGWGGGGGGGGGGGCQCRNRCTLQKDKFVAFGKQTNVQVANLGHINLNHHQRWEPIKKIISIKKCLQ
jgi:hypothetical protein